MANVTRPPSARYVAVARAAIPHSRGAKGPNGDQLHRRREDSEGPHLGKTKTLLKSVEYLRLDAGVYHRLPSILTIVAS